MVWWCAHYIGDVDRCIFQEKELHPRIRNLLSDYVDFNHSKQDLDFVVG